MDNSLVLKLQEPFDPRQVHFKPIKIKGDRALVVAHVDARAVMKRLDSVFGPAGWQTSLTPMADGSVICSLKVRMPDGTWIEKSDIGTGGDDPSNRSKGAASDGLKRAAVLLGVGRYLYSLTPQWVAYDPVTKKAASPQLPQWAQPKALPTPQPKTAA